MRLHALQYLRAFAALAVVFSHASTQLETYAEHMPHEFGVFGVDIFFVISGFIMVWIARDTDRPVRFFINRFRRVVPLYWFFTLLMGFILAALPFIFRNTSFDLPSLLLSLAFIPHASLSHPGEVWPILAPGWSLNYEMYFYLLFATALVLPAAWRVAAITAVITTVFVIAMSVGGDSVAVSFFTESIVFEFIFGMLLAVSFKQGHRLPAFAGVCLIVFGICWLLIDPLLPHAFRYGVPAVCIVAGSLYITAKGNRLGLLLGDSSYSLYLSHLFVLGALRKVLPPLLGEGAVAAWVFTIISCIICVIAAIFVHWIVDNWLLRVERLSFLKLKSNKQQAYESAR